MKKIIGIIMGGLFVFGMVIASSSMAMMCGGMDSGHNSHQQIAQSISEQKHEAVSTSESVSQEAAINVGNKICPVSGEKIDEKIKTTYEYEGKVYNFCCPMCVADFKKDPEKYIKKVKEELQNKEKTENISAESEGQIDESAGEGHHHQH